LLAGGWEETTEEQDGFVFASFFLSFSLPLSHLDMHTLSATRMRDDCPQPVRVYLALEMS
jgi:hypothetical protein